MSARRWVGFMIVAAIAISAAPRGPGFSTSVVNTVSPTGPVAVAKLNPATLDDLVKTDPVAVMGAALAKYRSEVRGFSATMHKRERIGKTFFPTEVIRMAVREEPFAVAMVWEKGARNQAEGTFYAAGENGGNMVVWRPNALLAKTLNVGPRESLARSASRYCLIESSIYHGHLRTFTRWKRVQELGQLIVEYKGRHPIPELGGKVCHELVRTCDPPEADSFGIDEPPRTAVNELFTTVRIFLDAETGIQLGAILARADGELVGSYLFRDVVVNPTFPAGQFTPEAFRK